MSAGVARSAARLAAVQALYQMDVTGKSLPDIIAEFESHWIGGEIEGERYNPAELAFFRDIVKGVLGDQTALDNAVNDALVSSWPLARIDSVMRAILRAGAYELKKRRDVPAKVVIKEYVDVAGAFFGRDESGMINAVLDSLGRSYRADELEARRA